MSLRNLQVTVEGDLPGRLHVLSEVAQDLPDRIEIRRDCELDELQRKLYLAELRRSREKVMKTVAEQGVAKSKIHVLAALTRLRGVFRQLAGGES